MTKEQIESELKILDRYCPRDESLSDADRLIARVSFLRGWLAGYKEQQSEPLPAEYHQGFSKVDGFDIHDLVLRTNKEES